VRFGNSVGAVVQVLMRSDIPAPEAFFRDHWRASPTGFGGQLRSGVQDGADLGEAPPRRLGNTSIFETFPRPSLACETNSFAGYLRPCFIEAIFAAIIARRVAAKTSALRRRRAAGRIRWHRWAVRRRAGRATDRFEYDTASLAHVRKPPKRDVASTNESFVDRGR
jgi:hypothetical protein